MSAPKQQEGSLRAYVSFHQEQTFQTPEIAQLSWQLTARSGRSRVVMERQIQVIISIDDLGHPVAEVS